MGRVFAYLHEDTTFSFGCVLAKIDIKLADSSNKAVERYKDRLNHAARGEIVNSAIQKAEEKLRKMLEDNPHMHREIISSAINEIDGIDIQ